MIPELIQQSIARNGFVVIAVPGSDGYPHVAYTIGLTDGARHPELLVFGLDQLDAHALLANLAQRILAGHTYAEGDQVKRVDEVSMALRAVPWEAARQHAPHLFRHYLQHRVAPDMLQLVPRGDTAWPWPTGYAAPLLRHPPAARRHLH